MHAIVRLGNGRSYTSAVFGHYTNNKTGPYDDIFYVVFDEHKKCLVRQYLLNPKLLPVIDYMVLIIDDDDTGWIWDEHGFGGIDFLPKKEALRIIDEGIIPDEIMLKCKKLDESYKLKDYYEITDDSEIQRLMNISGYFHDAYIKELEDIDNGIRVLFDGVWGCNIEMFFLGDVTYDVESRDPETCDPNWYGSTMIRKDGYIYFVDEDEMKVEDIGKGYCWFRAKQVRYRIIPE